MRLNEDPEIPAQINIVPMIDVIFAILTFFIVSTLFLTQSESLPVNLPKANTAQTQAKTRVAVTIDPQGRAFLNRQPIALNAVGTQVRRLVQPGQQTIVVLNADEAVNHGQVIAVMDQLRLIPEVRLAIATKKQ